MPDGTRIATNLPSQNEAPPLTNIHLEQAILGSLLTKPALAEHIPPSFHADHFYDPWHAEIYRTVLALGGNAQGSFAVVQALALGDRDKATYIAGLLNAVVGLTSGAIKAECETVTDLWRRRALAEIADSLRTDAHNSHGSLSSEFLIGNAVTKLELVANSAPTGRGPIMLADAIDDAITAGERRASGEDAMLSTGFPSIDRVLGGLESGCLYILAARPGMGKSGLGVQIGIHIAKQNMGVLLISLEMQAEQLGRRSIAYLSDVPAFAVRYGKWSQAEAERITQARKAVQDIPLSIVDEAGQNTAMIALKARAARRRHGLGCIIVDHLHIVAQDAAATRMGETWAVGKVSNDLKRLAKDMGVPVIALAQLNRSVENREDKRPSMADLRQSGNIEQDADAIMLLYRAEYYLSTSEPEQMQGESSDKYEKRVREWRDAKDRAAGKAELNLAKVREGQPTTIKLAFDGARTCFMELQEHG
jgi:replicative DNA helicase